MKLGGRLEFYKKEEADGELAESQLLGTTRGVIEFIGQELTVTKGYANKERPGKKKSFQAGQRVRSTQEILRRKREGDEETARRTML
jgi:hypothetical protein